MTPGEASATGKAMTIQIGEMLRPAAHVFDVKGGLVYLDLGWSENIGGHPIHFIAGSFNEIEMFGPGSVWGAFGDDDDVFIEVSDDTPDGTRDQAWSDVARIFPEYS
ncbi:MAG: hypothetical protein P8O92_08075 [Luminiphilus sp.]|nr:hypothetical protein [Luminiphilus sp.]